MWPQEGKGAGVWREEVGGKQEGHGAVQGLSLGCSEGFLSGVGAFCSGGT